MTDTTLLLLAALASPFILFTISWMQPLTGLLLFIVMFVIGYLLGIPGLVGAVGVAAWATGCFVRGAKRRNRETRGRIAHTRQGRHAARDARPWPLGN